MLGVCVLLGALQAAPETDPSASATPAPQDQPPADPPPEPRPVPRWRFSAQVAAGAGARWIHGLPIAGGDLLAALGYRKHTVGLVLEAEAFLGSTPPVSPRGS